MAIVNRATLKDWFQSGLRPLQEQYHNWIDSFVHKDDMVDIAKVQGLSTLIQNFVGIDYLNNAIAAIDLNFRQTHAIADEPIAIEIAAGTLLEKIVIYNGSNSNFENLWIGTNQFSNDIEEIDFNGPDKVIQVDLFFPNNTIIYFSNVTFVQVNLYLR